MTVRIGRRPFARAIPLLLSLAMAVAGCTGLAQPETPPPGEAPVPPVVDVKPPVASQAASVYFSDWQAQHLIPELRQVPQASGAELATQVVRELIAGPSDPNLRKVFPAGVKLLEPVKVEGGTARVNLSNELRTIQGTAGVTAALNALRLSLTDIEGIEKVQVLIEGQPGGDLGGITLSLMDRGLYLYPVMANPERVKYLQGRHDQGLETWRADPTKVAQWEGRMFGFTAAELQGAKVTQQGASATVQVTRGGNVYAFTLAQNKVSQGTGIWTVQALDPLVRHTLAGLPAAVKTWANNYTSTTIGVSKATGERTYLLASVEEGAVQIDSVAAKNGKLVVYVVEQGSERVAIASVSGPDAGLPVVFQWKTAPVGKASKYTAPDSLPTLANPGKLGEAKLAGDIAVITPTANQNVSGTISVTGYARHLFEANVVARLLDAEGKEVARARTTAGACCFDWGSFSIELTHTAPAGTYRLELGDFSPKDGAWEARIAIPVKVTK